MRNKIVFAMLASALFAAAFAGAQCSANKDVAQESRVALAAATNTKWPLPIPRNQTIKTLEDFRGALLLAGANVYQIESIRWRITPNDDLEIVALDGYTRDGLHMQFEKTVTDGRAVESVNDFTGFRFGRPQLDAKVLNVESIELSVDSAGFLSIGQMNAIDEATDQPIHYSHSLPRTKSSAKVVEEPLCGVRITAGCKSDNCDGACGAAPGCPCTGKTGACSGFTNTVCSGACPKGRTCNGFVTNCGCERDPVPVPPVGGVETKN